MEKFSEELFQRWVGALPYKNHPTVEGTEEATTEQFSEWMRKSWGDVNDEFNAGAQEAKNNGWLSESGTLTDLGKINLLQKFGRDKIIGQKEMKKRAQAASRSEAKDRQKFIHAVEKGTPQERAISVLGKFGMLDTHTVALTRSKNGNGYQLQLIRVEGGKYSVEWKMQKDKVDSCLGALEKYLENIVVGS